MGLDQEKPRGGEYIFVVSLQASLAVIFQGVSAGVGN